MRKWIMIGSCVDYFNKTSLWWFCTNVTGGMNGAVFDVGRVSWFQRGLLNGSFSSIVVHKNYKRRGFVQSWWGKEFLCSSVVFYIRTGSSLFCTDIAREGGSWGERFAQLLILMYVVPPKDSSWFSGVLWWRSFHFCISNITRGRS